MSKFAYDFKGPERWDVMVFKYPEDTSRNYIKRLAALPGDVPLMIEHMKGAEEYDKSREYLFDVGKKIGVSFG